jgi:chromate transporter
VLFALVVQSAGARLDPWLNGLKIVAVAVIAQAVWSMARTLTPDAPRATIAILAAIVTLVWPAVIPVAASQVAIILLAGIVGWRWLPAPVVTLGEHVRVPIGRRVAAGAAMLFVALLVGLPLLRLAAPSQGLAVFDGFFRTGSLVFGGGHVVLPLLEAEVVAPGWVTSEQFLIGYGAAQAIPGPLFTFSAYLGAVMAIPPTGVVGATIALVAIFLPAFLIVISTLPTWGALRTRPAVQSALRGINAAVVGLLLAALYQSAWVPTIKTPVDFAIALGAFGLLVVWKVPPWIVVLVTAVVGAAVAFAQGG